jgi:hypothetical protein
VVLAPLPSPRHLARATAGSAVGGLAQPTTLTGGLTGLLAWRLGTGALTPQMPGGRMKENLTVLTLALPDVLSHGPASPQAHD